jgi:hypothetical protein
MRRQLMKLIVPTEQALSMSFAAADAMGRARDGSPEAEAELRILTPLLKLRACRDNATVATGSLEARGGNGYIEDWVNPRLVRDAQVGLLWEGTSNINALDVITRAVGRGFSHRALAALLRRRLADARQLPAPFRHRLAAALDRALALAERVAGDRDAEALARQAATALYDAASAVLLAWEGSRPGADAGRALLARCVLEHRLSPGDPLAPENPAWERAATDAVLGGRALDFSDVGPLLVPQAGKE